MKSIRILNRVVELTPGGIRYEADQRHAEIIIQEMQLKGESKSVSTPGVKSEAQEASTELESDRATMYRALVARGNYLAQDRPEIQFAVKELCRSMSKPTQRYHPGFRST